MGRKLYQRKDPTMRYIANKQLWDAIATQCGITPSAVRAWRRVPVDRVHDVEAATGRRRSLIRPDIYRRRRSNNQQQARSA